MDSDGRAFHKDSESGPNSKITKITNITFLPFPTELSKLWWMANSFLINKMEPEVQVTSTKDNYLFETFSHLRASSANKMTKT